MDHDAAATCAGEEPGPVCASSALMDFLGRRHMLHLIRLFEGRPSLRFNAIRTATRAAPNLLAARLRELVDAGVLDRRDLGGAPPGVEYALTPRGRALLDGVLGLDGFIAEHGPLGRERARPRAAPPPRPTRL